MKSKETQKKVPEAVVNRKKDRAKRSNSSRAKKLVGDPAIWELPDPISITPYEEDGIRMTQISFESHLIQCKPVAVDKVFEAFLNLPKTAIDQFPWLAIKPWLDNTKEEVSKFWQAFSKASAIQERMWCLEGDKQVTWANERLVVDQVNHLRNLINSENFNTDDHYFHVIKLAEWLVHSVESEPQSLRRLYTLLKKPDSTKDCTNRERINRDVFFVFVKLVATQKKLPTKKQVEEASFLSKEKKMKSRAISELGLSGLPEALKSS